MTVQAAAGIAGKLGGDFRNEPEDVANLSAAARNLIGRSFADLGEAPVVDCHTHVVGIGAGGSRVEIHPEMQTWRHPARRLKATVFMSATGVREEAAFDTDYVRRLVRLARGFGRPVRIHVLALDRNYEANGTANPARTEFYVPNEYVVALAREYPDLFEPVISVHPFRHDALDELTRWSGQGVRFVKWLPNAQNIDPADPRHNAFYRRMKELNMVLLTHTGREGAVSASASQEFGNPLRLRRALDAGVTVIMAHCASRGTSEDLDRPGARADNFDLFLRMMDEPRYRERLFGDISAMTQWNRLPRPLLELMRRPDLQARLVNGSDYPMPAVNCVISLGGLERRGMITREERNALREIYDCNPLLFDFVLKRTLREPKTGGRLSPAIFTQVIPPSLGTAVPGGHVLYPMLKGPAETAGSRRMSGERKDEVGDRRPGGPFSAAARLEWRASR